MSAELRSNFLRTQIQSDLEAGRIRVDDLELADRVQAEVKIRWPLVDTENLPELGDLTGFREDFLKIFGFGIDGVDYDADVDPQRIS